MSEIDLSVLGEVYLTRLLGSTLLNKHGTMKEKDWKRILQRIVIAIEKAIKQNVVSDNFHQSQIVKYVCDLRKTCKKKEVSDPDIILHMAFIIFELLGGAPNYSHRRSLNRKHEYLLREQRTLWYLQSPYQKIKTILRASKEKPYSGFHKYEDLFNKFALNFRSDAEEFLKWYKKKYSKMYLMIF